MAGMEAESVDAVVTDPPYGLEFMGREWDRLDLRQPFRGEVQTPDNPYGRTPVRYPYGDLTKAARMQQDWHEAWAREALRVLRPGGHLLAFGGTRTFHRLTCAIEDAGFEIRDCVSWNYGSGFPKSLDVSKAIDRAAGADREVVGDYTAPDGKGRGPSRYVGFQGRYRWGNEWFEFDKLPPHAQEQVMGSGREIEGMARAITAPATPEAARWQGWGTALKPAWEPIVVARKPLAGTVAANVLAHGTGALNVDGCRVGTEQRFNPPAGNNGTTPASFAPVNISDYEGTHAAGRWPANVVLSHTPDCREVGVRKVRGTSRVDRDVGDFDTDGNTYGAGSSLNAHQSPGYADPDGLETVPAFECSPDCPVRMLDEQAGERLPPGGPGRQDEYPAGMFGATMQGPLYLNESGGPSRFFYTAKASSAERDGATHPTVKPLELMRWLVRLVTPPGGLVLDPFAGSGTTLIACRLEGFRAVGIERVESYCAMAAERYRRRYDPAAAEWSDARRKDDGLAQLGLFGGVVPVEEVAADG